MRKQYDFKNSKKNPYAKKLKKQITIRIDQKTIKYFKNLAGDIGIPYQNLINMYLSECAHKERKISISWN